jgi:hypothetical protein
MLNPFTFQFVPRHHLLVPRDQLMGFTRLYMLIDAFIYLGCARARNRSYHWSEIDSTTRRTCFG